MEADVARWKTNGLLKKAVGKVAKPLAAKKIWLVGSRADFLRPLPNSKSPHRPFRRRRLSIGVVASGGVRKYAGKRILRKLALAAGDPLHKRILTLSAVGKKEGARQILSQVAKVAGFVLAQFAQQLAQLERTPLPFLLGMFRGRGLRPPPMRGF